MTTEAIDLWSRACDSWRAADLLLSQSFWDAAVSRAYYAAFYAVSAQLALDGKTYSKHSAVESAVHRDLVKSGRWQADLGALFSSLRDLRTIGDYGGERHATAEDATQAVEAARKILDAVRTAQPEVFANLK